MRFKTFGKILKYFFLGMLILLAGSLIYFLIAIRVDPPVIEENVVAELETSYCGDNFRICGPGRLQHNSFGLWEVFVKGDPFELGVINGKLTHDLIRFQEDAFVEQIYTLVPSKAYLHVLKYFIAWFNRSLEDHIPMRYQLEIYGVSLSASDAYDFIGDKYRRILNYHAAHDMGHALQNMNLVGCTAFSVWDEESADGSLVIGRNFDFHVGEAFNENKMLLFVEPDAGHRFVIVTWGGMIGAVSGMNEQGLTVTLNAAKSGIPFSSATPVSILARNILQFASDIKEAYAIADESQTFVAESFLIGSAKDGRAAIIEKTDEETVLYQPEGKRIIQTNHFLAPELAGQELNRENMKNTATVCRYDRVKELLDGMDEIGPREAAGILRDRKGMNGKDIGMGNEKAINQLIAHHSIIFKPEQRLFWISAGPYPLGEYLCYNLDSVFAHFPAADSGLLLFEQKETLEADPFLKSEKYARFVEYKEHAAEITRALKEGRDTTFDAGEFIRLNPEYFMSYKLLGEWYQQKDQWERAEKYYREALTKVIPTEYERRSVQDKLAEVTDRN
ncbi:MAG: C45 family autoproteolytic acyltransferase/hydrolase [Bacteroidales bacterium]